MRLVALEVRGFRGIREIALDFDSPLTVIQGENGRGKSSLLQAIEWCIFGAPIEKKSSGIAARVDWEIAFRGARSTEVRLRFADDPLEDPAERRTLELCRAREAKRESFECVEETRFVEHAIAQDVDGSPKQAELFSLPAPANPRRKLQTRTDEYSDEQATARLVELGFPSWDEWRRAFCQHQEDPRNRVVDSASRSAVLSSLLGLDEWTRVRARLDSVGAKKAIAKLDELEARTGDYIERALTTRDDRATQIRERLAARGVTVDTDALTLRETVTERLCEQARSIGSPFGLTDPAPRDDPAVFAKWLRGFTDRLWTAAQETTKQRLRIEKREALTIAARRVRERVTSLRSASAALEQHTRAHGDEDAIQKRRAKVEREIQSIETSIRQRDARESLLREAQLFLREREGDERSCPLCASPMPDLALRIEKELTSDSNRAGATLRESLESRRSANRQEHGNLRTSRDLVAAELEARRLRDEALAVLSTQLSLSDDSDPLKTAEDAIRVLDREIDEGQAHLASLDEQVHAFKRDVEVWEELGRLARAETLDSTRPDPDRLSERVEFDAALDRAAAFAVDIEFLSRLAREEQAKASETRLAEVQASFGVYLSSILGDRALGGQAAESGAAKYRFVQKGTAQKLRYDIVDTTGKSALAIANQATLSAIALALLFARAEARSREALPAFVILDDPAQSLDAAHAAGLARSLERLLHSCPVVVACSSGPFADALEKVAAKTRRTHVLDTFSPEQGVSLARAEGP